MKNRRKTNALIIAALTPAALVVWLREPGTPAFGGAVALGLAAAIYKIEHWVEDIVTKTAIGARLKAHLDWESEPGWFKPAERAYFVVMLLGFPMLGFIATSGLGPEWARQAAGHYVLGGMFPLAVLLFAWYLTEVGDWLGLTTGGDTA